MEQSSVDEAAPMSRFPQESLLPELEALQKAAHLGEQQKLRSRSIQRQAVARSSTVARLEDYAAPLSPLKERDLEILVDLFQREDIYDIEADVAQMLLRLLPEPCWEENPFEFLQDFL